MTGPIAWLIPAQELANGTVMALLSVTVSTSCAAIMFNGPLEPLFGLGVGIGLITAVVLGIAGLLRSSAVFAVIGPQPAVAVLLAVMANSIAAAGGSAEGAEATIRAGILVTTIASAAILLVLGRLRLGRYVRLIPTAVVGGVIAATGWLVAKGGVVVLIGYAPMLADLNALLDATSVMHLLPGLAFAVHLAWSVPRHDYALPALIAAVDLTWSLAQRGDQMA
jgi:SulP family sulfate permease